MFNFSNTQQLPDLDFEEVVIDTAGSQYFNTSRLEGKVELPLTKRNVYVVATLFVLISLLFLSKLFWLQVVNGAEYYNLSINNKIYSNPIVAERGVIYDRNQELLAWNQNDDSDTYSFPTRTYSNRQGIGQLVGYVSYPAKDSNGFYYDTSYTGRTGLEAAYNAKISGTNGTQLVEMNALQEVITKHEIEIPQAGEPVTISVDVSLSEAWYNLIATSTVQADFRSGAGAIMDVHTGEIVAMTSFPSFDPEVMADGDEVNLIAAYNQDTRLPFLNKVHAGVYTPGSVVKPFMAYAALEEDVIHPETEIISTGELIIPNPHNPNNPARFTDWRAHGAVDMRKAIAYSSNIYFYQISGGYKDQEGIGIDNIYQYMTRFGFGSTTGFILSNEQTGVVPSRTWKEKTFAESWRLGNTYHTSIGQFGWQVTPLQMLTAYGALANGGKLFTPHFQTNQIGTHTDLNLNPDYLQIIREGMRMAVNYDGGTARSLERGDVAIAAKSGTAEIGSGNAYVNSWAAGYWPYDDPQYAFILLMDHAPRSNSLGATTIMGKLFDWIAKESPQYLTGETASTTDTVGE